MQRFNSDLYYHFFFSNCRPLFIYYVVHIIVYLPSLVKFFSLNVPLLLISRLPSFAILPLFHFFWLQFLVADLPPLVLLSLLLFVNASHVFSCCGLKI